MDKRTCIIGLCAALAWIATACAGAEASACAASMTIKIPVHVEGGLADQKAIREKFGDKLRDVQQLAEQKLGAFLIKLKSGEHRPAASMTVAYEQSVLSQHALAKLVHSANDYSLDGNTTLNIVSLPDDHGDYNSLVALLKQKGYAAVIPPVSCDDVHSQQADDPGKANPPDTSLQVPIRFNSPVPDAQKIWGEYSAKEQEIVALIRQRDADSSGGSAFHSHSAYSFDNQSPGEAGYAVAGSMNFTLNDSCTHLKPLMDEIKRKGYDAFLVSPRVCHER